jgi:hypothetical protein
LVLAPTLKVTLPAENSLLWSCPTNRVKNASPVNQSCGNGCPKGNRLFSADIFVDVFVKDICKGRLRRLYYFIKNTVFITNFTEKYFIDWQVDRKVIVQSF